MTENNTEFKFQTETQKLLQIIINSLYKNKDIFLRELISNSSDALNRVRIKQLTNEVIFEPGVDLEITISIDSEAKTLTISDTGIGMSKDELIRNLGTIAQSGTEEFASSLNSEDTTDLIGQFGVGFYSAFLVAKKVTVNSKSFDSYEDSYLWTSEGVETFKIEKSDKEHRGTEITIEFMDDIDDYLADYKIKDIVKQYSNYVEFPIKLGDDIINEQTAIWRVSPKEVKDEQYNQFYNHIGNFGEPLTKLHVIVDNPYQFYSILYFPKTKTKMFMQDDKDWGIRLYNRKILIDEKNKDILPEYLRFIEGVVDAEDFDLNVSREVVQSTRVQRQMENYLHKKIIQILEKMAEDEEEKYLDFYKEYGSYLKEGISGNTKFKDRLVDLLRFFSTTEEGITGSLSLASYVERMKPEQDQIYYLSGLDIEMLKKSPHLEYYKKEGIEVLLMGEAIDSFLMMNLHEYHDKKFFLIDQDETVDEEDPKVEDSDDDADDKPKVKTGPFAPLLNRTMEVLQGKITDVKMSDRLVDSVSRLVTSKGGISSDLQRAMKIMESQSGSNPILSMMSKALQFNPNHEIIANLNKLIEEDAENEMIDVIIHQLHDNARIIDGDLPDFTKMIKRTEKLISKNLSQ